MGSSETLEAGAGLPADSRRVPWPDRVVEVAYDYLLVLFAFVMSTWPHFAGSVEPFAIGRLLLPSKFVAGVMAFEALLLLARRQSFGMLMTHAHVVRSTTGRAAGPLRALLPRVLVYVCLLGEYHSADYGMVDLGALVAVDLLWAIFDPTTSFCTTGSLAPRSGGGRSAFASAWRVCPHS